MNIIYVNRDIDTVLVLKAGINIFNFDICFLIQLEKNIYFDDIYFIMI